MAYYIAKTNHQSSRYHIAAGLDEHDRKQPLKDAGLCGRLDVSDRYPMVHEWDPWTMSVPGWNPDARRVICGDCLRIWDREYVETRVGAS